MDEVRASTLCPCIGQLAEQAGPSAPSHARVCSTTKALYLIQVIAVLGLARMP